MPQQAIYEGEIKLPPRQPGSLARLAGTKHEGQEVMKEPWGETSSTQPRGAMGLGGGVASSRFSSCWPMPINTACERPWRSRATSTVRLAPSRWLARRLCSVTIMEV